MPYQRTLQRLQSIPYRNQIKKMIVFNKMLCNILILKNCIGGARIFGYSIPEPSIWELTWASKTITWYFFGTFAMKNWSRKMLMVYIYSNPSVILSPLLISTIKYFSGSQALWNALLGLEPQNFPMMIFWFLFSIAIAAAQVEFLYCGHSYLQLITR